MSDEQAVNESAANDTETPAGPETTNGAASVEELQARVAQLEKEAAEYKDQWMRAIADYKNFKRRADQERAELIRSASGGLLLKLLPVMDDLERAVSSATPELTESAWYAGFKLIPQKLQTLLESEGISTIPAVGEEFNPSLHEAVIFEEDGSGETNRVVAELRKGYKLHDRVLRPSMVKVGKS